MAYQKITKYKQKCTNKLKKVNFTYKYFICTSSFPINQTSTNAFFQSLNLQQNYTFELKF